MISNIKNKINLAILAVLSICGFMLFIGPTVNAAVAPPSSDRTGASAAAKQVCQGISQADSATGCDSTANGDKVSSLASTIINLFSWVVGLLSIIMVIYGGFRYVTSAGDASKLTAARQTITYALVGLVLVALAQIIVRFVIGQFI